MPKETLLALAADVDRLLAAGAALAPADDGLRRRAKALRDLGQKVAALNPVADAADRVLAANPKAAGPALLDLVQVARQVRSSLAAAGSDGAAEAVPPSGPWETPLPVRDVNPLLETLTGTGMGRRKALKGALARGSVADLRLMRPMFGALDGNNSGLAELVAKRGLPAFGPAMLPELKRDFDIKGKAKDARRLTAICQLDAKGGVALCHQALQEGSPALMVRALKLLPKYDPKNVEKAALALKDEKNRDVRVAALLALAGSSSDAALDALMTALLDDVEEVWWQVSDALDKLPHKQAIPRLVRELEPVAEELKKPAPKAKPQPAGGKKPKGPTPEEKRYSQVEERGQRILNTIENRDDADAAADAVLPLMKHPHANLSDTAVRVLGSMPKRASDLTPALLDLLKTAKNAGLKDTALRALQTLGEKGVRSPETVKVLLALYKDKKTPASLRSEVLQALGALCGENPEVLKLLREALKDKNQSVRQSATNGLEAMGFAAAAALPEVLALVTGKSSTYWAYTTVARIDPDGRALPQLVELLKDKKADMRRMGLMCIQEYGNRAKGVLPAVEALRDDKETYMRYWVESAVQQIERDPQAAQMDEDDEDDEDEADDDA